MDRPRAAHSWREFAIGIGGVLTALALGQGVAFAAPAAAGQAGGYHAPRTGFGQPDLQGVWTNASMTRLERPAELPTLVVAPAEAAAYEKRRTDRYAKEVAPVAPDAGAPPAGTPGQDAEQWYAAPEGLARVGGQILYRFEVVDPKAYTQPWRGEMPLRATPDRLLEYACHEGNYDFPGILAGARAGERPAPPIAH